MIPKISFRYGYGALERCGLVLWTLAWGIGLFYVLQTGVVYWETPNGAVEYSRAAEPFGYWTIVAVTTGVCILGLALTFEISFEDGQDSDAKQ